MEARTGLALERAATLPACRRHLIAAACAVVGPKIARAPATRCRRSGHLSGGTLPELAALARRGPNLMRSGYIRWHSEVRTESSKSHGQTRQHRRIPVALLVVDRLRLAVARSERGKVRREGRMLDRHLHIGHHRRDGRHIAWQAFRKLSRFDIRRDPVTRKHSSESAHPGVGQS